MKRANVVVKWCHGLHMQPAALLVKAAKNFRSNVYVRYGEKIADIRSILSLVALCATMGAGLEIEANGEDEKEAVQAVEKIFAQQGEATTTEKGAETKRT